MDSPKVATFGQQYNVKEKYRPTASYTVHLHKAMPGHKTIQNKNTVEYIVKRVVIIYDNNAIEPYNNRGLSQE